MWHITVKTIEYGASTRVSLDVQRETESGVLKQEVLTFVAIPRVSGGMFQESWRDLFNLMVEEATRLAEQSLDPTSPNSK